MNHFATYRCSELGVQSQQKYFESHSKTVAQPQPYLLIACWASILLPARNVTLPKMARYFRVWNMLS